jgi:hypothetical protein
MRDVKEIYQIPEIENFLNIEFSFGSYDLDSNIRTYSLHDFQSYDLDSLNSRTFSLDNEKSYSIEISIISDESTIFNKEQLSDLITQENIQYFSFSTYLIIDTDEYEKLTEFCYRPFVKESEKKY